MLTKPFRLVAAAALCAALAPLAAAQYDGQPGAGPDQLREQDVRAHVGFLASDALEGRQSGRTGGDLAERYVEAHFRRLGLQPLPGQTELRLPFTFGANLAHNVVGVLPGRDPAVRGKYLAIGGHMDHAGIGGPGAMGFPGEIHNGADDNASGTAGVLELAEWYAAHPPRHSVIFMGFAAEESGLLGSAHLVREKVVPVSEVVAMINLDMIGRSNGYLFVGGLGTAKEFKELLDPVFAQVQDVELELSDLGEAPSDNTSFYQGGVPALFFFTNVHDDYHRPGDDAEKIDYAGHVRTMQIARDVFDTLDRAPSITFTECDGMGMPADFNQRMQKHFQLINQRSNERGRLGLIAEDGAGGLLVKTVQAGSAGEAAGVQVGDLITRVDGRETYLLRDLTRAMGGHVKGDVIEIVLLREGAEIKIQATLK